jgi:ketosteroid isomerase-like protein
MPESGTTVPQRIGSATRSAVGVGDPEVVRTTAGQFREAVEQLDATAAVALMRDDVRLYSPVPRTPFEGREMVAVIFEFLSTVVERHRFVSVSYGESEAVLCFAGEVAGRECDWMQRIQIDDDGRIWCVTDLMRPLSAVVALKEAAALAFAPPGPPT